jgi:hypothetical protein
MNNQDKEKTINEFLVEAVNNYDFEGVKNFLRQGADPNYNIFGYEDWDNSESQPTTPLKLVMFRISDSFVNDDGLGEFAKIAKLLIEYGADPGPAMVIAESRYGKYDPKASQKMDEADRAFINVWDIVANAAK